MHHLAITICSQICTDCIYDATQISVALMTVYVLCQNIVDICSSIKRYINRLLLSIVTNSFDTNIICTMCDEGLGTSYQYASVPLYRLCHIVFAMQVVP